MMIEFGMNLELIYPYTLLYTLIYESEYTLMKSSSNVIMLFHCQVSRCPEILCAFLCR